jgi:hypothetical protein
VVLADLILGQGSFRELQDQGGFPTVHARFESSVIPRQ